MDTEYMMYSTYLSKSLFLRGLQCYKALYLFKYHPELKDETSATQEKLFQIGADVGIYARKLFPGGKAILFEDIPLSIQIERTLAEINRGATTLYEAAFSHNEVFVKVDILHKRKKGWEIYEIKASTDIKDVYIDDVAIQYYVVKGAGLDVSKASIVHINNEYVRYGDIEVEKLFTIEDITDIVREKQSFIKEEIKRMKEMLRGNIPEIDIGEHCSKPYDCDFTGYCWQHIPEESVFSLRGRGVNKFELYMQGIIDLKDIPMEILPYHQKIQLDATLEKKNIINKRGIKEFLGSLWYPMYFLDFETFSTAIPPFDGTRPYQHIPFQHSLHFKENENAELRHYEYLALPGVDPREELIVKLLDEIPAKACIIVYNQSFETGILQSFIDWYPEYRNKIECIIKNIMDLMLPFKRKDIYFWQMNGSYSMKTVLPALVPELSYDEMDIKDGEMAMDAYFRMCNLDNPLEIENIRRALLEYCRLDTLGMVKIMEKIREICS